MDRMTPRLTAEAALLRNDEYLALFSREHSMERVEVKCQVEFSL